MRSFSSDLLDVLNVSGLVVVLDDLGGSATPAIARTRRDEKRVSDNPRLVLGPSPLTEQIELLVPATCRRTR